MSDLLFPTLRGLTYPIGKTPHWKTLQTQTVSGVKKFVQMYTYPYYELNLKFNYLGDENSQADDIHRLAGFYNKMGGAGIDFLFADPLFEDNRVTDQPFAITDGVATSWQLAHTYGGFTEPIFGIIEKPTLYMINNDTGERINLTEGEHYYVSSEGTVVCPLGAPVAGFTLYWTGKWYYRCHFANDEAELEQIFYGGWALDELVLESIKVD